ncbi:hypothetical protein IscW_ISCW002279 [Ixodes scapularis]|uniref:Uncharacterized protein n=1 Tax=Ixodes scapularis TaxID=6945 RepID=B7PBB2_IXOSC|nr:hypothetical protein IscW_ISCW002279 [Ixodes scapularis]|eukprot:XP_002407880.1 hypothetical protein IscW_ISCW002279 [Ixodes scapularis]
MIVQTQLYVTLQPSHLEAFYEVSDKQPVISIGLAGCEVLSAGPVRGSAPGEECFPIQLVKQPIR